MLVLLVSGSLSPALATDLRAWPPTVTYINHLMPTRLLVDIPLDKAVVYRDVFRNLEVEGRPKWGSRALSTWYTIKLFEKNRKALACNERPYFWSHCVVPALSPATYLNFI